jgi:predicted hotdog family 3-hydroxylacyl-ACP dehydratase
VAVKPLMVIIPTVLTGLIKEVDDRKAGQLGLAFAERSIQVCANMLSAEERHSSLSYLQAARNLVEGQGTISELAEAHRAYYSARNQHSGLSDDVTWVASIAVAASCQRQMEDAGILRKKRYMPGLLDVAKAAQAVAGRCATASEVHQEDGDGSGKARRARWLEAKWQLLFLIESVPFPGDPHPESLDAEPTS